MRDECQMLVKYTDPKTWTPSDIDMFNKFNTVHLG